MSINTPAENIQHIIPFSVSILAHKKNKAEKSADGYKPFKITNTAQLIDVMNTYHVSFCEFKGEHRSDKNIIEGTLASVIKLDVDAEGALNNVLKHLEAYEYVLVPSQSGKDYKRHIIVLCNGEADNRSSGYSTQVDAFLQESGISVEFLDERPLYSRSGYLAPADCGEAYTVDTAREDSEHHAGKRYKLISLEAHGIVVQDDVNSQRGLLKGLKTAQGKAHIKAVNAKNVNILEEDSIIYYFGRPVLVSDIVAQIEDGKRYSGFSCPIANDEHTMDLEKTPYAFAFRSNTGGDVIFKCTGNACSHKPHSIMDAGHRYKIYSMVQNSSTRVCIFDTNINQFLTNGQDKNPSFLISAAALKLAQLGITEKTDEGKAKVLSDQQMKTYLSTCDDVMIVCEPFKPRGFSEDSKNKHATKVYNEVPMPRFEVITKDATPIVKEALSIFEPDLKVAGYSVFLIILCAQLFGDRAILASPALVGDPKTAKTFYTYEILKEYWGELITIIDAQVDSKGWGDISAGKRHVVYNDLDKMDRKIFQLLVGKIKREATEGDDGYHNMKGGKIVRATASNRSLTSNYLEAVPIDAEGKDRRIYVPRVDFSKVDGDKMAQAFSTKINFIVATQNRRDLICYLYKIWLEMEALSGEDKKEINNLLYVEVPMTEEKRAMMTTHMADGKALIHSLDVALTATWRDRLSPFIKEDEENITFLDEVTSIMINERENDGKGKWFISEDTLTKVRASMRSHTGSGNASKVEAAQSFIGNRCFSTQSVNSVKNKKGIKINIHPKDEEL